MAHDQRDGAWWQRERSFGYVTTTELVWKRRKNGTAFSAQLSSFCDLFRRQRVSAKAFARAGSKATRAATNSSTFSGEATTALTCISVFFVTVDVDKETK